MHLFVTNLVIVLFAHSVNEFNHAFYPRAYQFIVIIIPNTLNCPFFPSSALSNPYYPSASFTGLGFDERSGPGLGPQHKEAFGDIDALMSQRRRPSPSLPSSSTTDRRKKGPHSSEHSKKRGGKDGLVESTGLPSPSTPVVINLHEWKGNDGDDAGGGGGEERGKLLRVSPEQHQSEASSRLSRGLATTSTIPLTDPFTSDSFVPTMAPLHTALTRKTTVRPASASRQRLGPSTSHAGAGVRTSTNSMTMGSGGANVGGVGIGKKGKKRERQPSQPTIRPSSAPSSSSRHHHHQR